MWLLKIQWLWPKLRANLRQENILLSPCPYFGSGTPTSVTSVIPKFYTQKQHHSLWTRRNRININIIDSFTALVSGTGPSTLVYWRHAIHGRRRCPTTSMSISTKPYFFTPMIRACLRLFITLVMIIKKNRVNMSHTWMEWFLINH